jgi:hypothetical protein
MTKEEAYCCLNCGESAGCCGPCGECSECCKDCGDTSSCVTSAYFGKDDKIYKAYTATYFDWYTQYNWLVDREASFGSINGTYESITNETLKYGSTTFNSWMSDGGACDIGPDTMYTKSTTTYNGKTSTNVSSNRGLCGCNDFDGCLGLFADYCFECGCTCDKIFSGSSTGGVGTIPKVDASAPSCGMFKDGTHDRGGTVTFIIPLKTYNSLGEIVADPTPATAYNPCNPIRTATAPACHFFHP